MPNHFLKIFGVEMPSDFPASVCEAVYWLVDRKRRTSPPEIWGQYRDAWKALSYHYLSCAIHDESYTASAKHHGDSPPHPERHNQEHHLFGFFYTGLASLEALHYGLFAMGALVRPQEFLLVTDDNRREATPQNTFMTYARVFPNEALTLALGALKTAQEWKAWNVTRNVLSHRMSPGRDYLLSTAESGPGGAVWPIQNGIEIAIDTGTTSSRREWLSRQLFQILDSTHSFATQHF